MQCVRIITQAGLARSDYIEAVHKAAVGDFGAAEELMKEGRCQFQEGHRIHVSMIQRESEGEAIPFSLLLVHTEDQLLAAEQFKILSEELINSYRRINRLEKGE